MHVHKMLCYFGLHAFDKHKDAAGRRWACLVCHKVVRPDNIDTVIGKGA